MQVILWVKEREFAAIVQFKSTVRSTFDRHRFRKSTYERGFGTFGQTATMARAASVEVFLQIFGIQHSFVNPSMSVLLDMKAWDFSPLETERCHRRCDAWYSMPEKFLHDCFV